MSSSSMGRCASCGKRVDMRALDAKPKALAGYRGADLPERLCAAAERGEGFDRLECADCFGPGYVSLMPGEAA